jgi:cytochrome c oxidase subunit 2
MRLRKEVSAVAKGLVVGLVLLNVVVLDGSLVQGADSDQGKKVYEAKRCAMCHAIGGQGGKIGPDLSDVGNKRDNDWLKKFLKDPKGTIPNAKMLPVKATDEEVAALVDYLLSLKR